MLTWAELTYQKRICERTLELSDGRAFCIFRLIPFVFFELQRTVRFLQSSRPPGALRTLRRGRMASSSPRVQSERHLACVLMVVCAVQLTRRPSPTQAAWNSRPRRTTARSIRRHTAGAELFSSDFRSGVDCLYDGVARKARTRYRWHDSSEFRLAAHDALDARNALRGARQREWSWWLLHQPPVQHVFIYGALRANDHTDESNIAAGSWRCNGERRRWRRMRLVGDE